MLSVPIIATTTCADFRCALGRFVGCTYRPRLLPGAAGRQSPRPPDAGAQTDLSSCVLGCANVPIPLRRTVPRGCNSKVFTPSMSFAQSGMGSAPSRLRQEGGIVTTLQDSIHATDRLLARPQKGLCHDASTLRISPRAGHQLHGCLAITVAGLPPASRTHAQDAPTRPITHPTPLLAGWGQDPLPASPRRGPDGRAGEAGPSHSNALLLTAAGSTRPPAHPRRARPWSRTSGRRLYNDNRGLTLVREHFRGGERPVCVR